MEPSQVSKALEYLGETRLTPEEQQNVLKAQLSLMEGLAQHKDIAHLSDQMDRMQANLETRIKQNGRVTWSLFGLIAVIIALATVFGGLAS